MGVRHCPLATAAAKASAPRPHPDGTRMVACRSLSAVRPTRWYEQHSRRRDRCRSGASTRASDCRRGCPAATGDVAARPRSTIQAPRHSRGISHSVTALMRSYLSSRASGFLTLATYVRYPDKSSPRVPKRTSTSRGFATRSFSPLIHSVFSTSLLVMTSTRCSLGSGF